MRTGKTGKRRYRANVEKHNGSVDAHGQPLTTDAAWDTVIANWPCEVVTTNASEDSTGGGTIMAYEIHGTYITESTVAPNMRMIIDGNTYDVVAAYDPDGRKRHLKVEAKRELYG